MLNLLPKYLSILGGRSSNHFLENFNREDYYNINFVFQAFGSAELKSSSRQVGCYP